MVEGHESLGPYTLVRRLGLGGMAETFEAVRVDPSGFEQRVCLKRVLPAFGADAGFVERFEREALLAARLRHSNVVGVLEFGAADGVPYMALELVDGPDLRTFVAGLPERRLPLELSLLIASDVAMALAYAHAPEAGAPGVVHRDVSPSNVLLGRSGDVKLADFGIAKAMDGAGGTASGEVRGKIPYMSPEQMRGHAVDGRADLFSLGVLLFEMLAGVRPFDGAHDVETMTHVLADERKRLEALAPEVPTAVVAIVDRLLASRPEDRFADADALLDALESAGVDPRARRALATAVEETLGGASTRGHLTGRVTPPPPPGGEDPLLARDAPAEEERDARTTAALRGRAARAEKRRSRRPLLLAVAVGAIALGAGFALVPSPPSPPPGEAVARRARDERAGAARVARTPLPAAASGASHATTQPSPASPAPAAERARPETGPGVREVALEPEPAAGRLRVTVVPWGRVWIDGRAAGRAPRTVSLPRGEHLVQAGFERPAASRRIRVIAGRSVQVQFELE